MDKTVRWQMEGMMYCINLLRDAGFTDEQLEPALGEVRLRRATEFGLGYTKNGIVNCLQAIKNNTFDTLTIMTCYVLNQKFGFGEKRLTKFCDEFTKQSEAMETHYVTWKDLQEEMAGKIPIDVEIRWIGNDPTAGVDPMR